MNKNIVVVNRILLGLVMLVPGLLKLFVMKPVAIVGLLSGLGFFAPTFFAWVLILSEIVFGIAILASWRLKYTVWPPIIIMIVAAFTVYWGNWSSFIMHIVVASNYLMLSYKSR
ncbi:DoxX family protein [Candidatus Pacearchaeota archaeon]|nr:DoxX family protein [Candidatus Pacearchaeota archaeon]